MRERKKVAILVAIALILAATAIILNIMDPEVPTERAPSQDQPDGGIVGVEVEQPTVEDKLAQETPQ